MSERFYCSDHHLWHHNILRYGERPFKDLMEMHEQLLERHNSIVKPQDHVSFLGDVTILRGGRENREKFIREVRKYNGHKRLYLGNHDHFPIQVYLDAGFEKIYATWRSDERIIFSHFPLHPMSLSGVKANIHGHIHQHKEYDAVRFPANFFGENNNGRKQLPERIVPYINVSVEVINYTPIHLDEILQKIRIANADR